MTITKEQAVKLLYECATVTLGGGEGSEEVITTTKLGVILTSKGIEPYKLGWYNPGRSENMKENVIRAGQFLKEWGELLLSEEIKDEDKNPGV